MTKVLDQTITKKIKNKMTLEEIKAILETKSKIISVLMLEILILTIIKNIYL